MPLIVRILERVSNALLWLGALALVVMMIHVAADIASKLVLRRPLKGTLELVSLYYMVAAVFLPLGAVQAVRGHINVMLFTQRLSDRLQCLLDAFVDLAVGAFCGLLAYRAALSAVDKTRVGEIANNIEFQILTWPGRWLPVVGLSVACAYALLHAVMMFGGRNVELGQAAPEEK